MLDMLVSVYDETQELCVAHQADDRDTAVAVLTRLIDRKATTTALMAWTQILGGTLRTGQAAIDELPWPADQRAAEALARLVTAGNGVGAMAGVVEQVYRTASDDDIWAILWFSSVAVSRLLNGMGGLAHWRKIALAHRAALIEDGNADLVYPAATFVALASVGRNDDARNQLEDIVIGNSHALAGLIQLWIMLGSRWLRGRTRRIVDLDGSGIPTAMYDPAEPITLGDHDRVSRLILGVVDAVASGDADTIGDAMRPIIALSFGDRVSLV